MATKRISECTPEEMELIRAKKRQYYYEHKEQHKEYAKKYREKHAEELKERRKEYYQNNKGKIYASQQKYNQKHRKEITDMIVKRRKEVAEELKAKGQKYVYLPKTERENKMVVSLAKKIDTSEIIARELLEQRDWNYKAIIMENKGE
jgi:hypothetical protein